MMNKRIAAILVACILVTQVSVGDVWEDVAGYQYGDEPNPCEQAEKLLQETPVGDYGRIEMKLIALVASKNSTQPGKAVACRFLQQVGTKRCIPAVSGLLSHEILSDYARLVLERLKSDEADKAMRGALEKAPDKAKIGILGSLAERRDSKAVKSAGRLAHSRNPAVAKAAIATLGKIGGKEAARQLSSLKPAQELVRTQMQAMVACAGSLSGSDAVALCDKVLAGTCASCRIAALRVLTTADAAKASALIAGAIQSSDVKLRRGGLSIVADTRGERLTKDMLKLIRRLPPDRKAGLIVALGARGDKAALNSIMGSIRSDQAVVRDAAISAVSKLGDAGVVKLLLSTADSPELRSGVAKAIAGMGGESINTALVESLRSRTLRKAAIEASIARGCTEAAPDLLKLVKDNDPDVRKGAWAGLGALGDDDDMSSVMEAVVKIKEAKDLSYAEAAVRKMFSRAENRSKCFKAIAEHYAQATEGIKGVILDLGVGAGDSNALRLERNALESPNKQLYARALRALAKWPNKSACSDLLSQAQSASEEVDRIVALRGYIRIAGTETAGLSAADRLEMLKTATRLAKRNEEKKQIVSGLQYAVSPESLEMLKQYVDDPAFQAEAETSAANLIEKLYKRHPGEVKAMAEQLANSKNKNVAKKAQKIVAELKKTK